jgi:hypothetical protein
VILCRDDAEFGESDHLKRLLGSFVRINPAMAGLVPVGIKERIHSLGGGCVSVRGLVSDQGSDPMLCEISQAVHSGGLLPRIEPCAFNAEPPAVPTLDAFRFACARRRLPLVDVWHKACGFPLHHYQVLEAMDGSLDSAALAARARLLCPDLAFEPWLRHLAARGMFA